MASTQSLDVRKVFEDSVGARTITAERVVLSCVLRTPERSYEAARKLISGADFSDEFHHALFEQVGVSLADGDPLEAAMIGERVASRLPQGAYPGLQYLRKLMAMPEGEGDVVAYARVVLEHSTRRILEEKLTEHLRRLRSSANGDISGQLAQLREEIEELASRTGVAEAKSFASLGEYAEVALDKVQEVLDKQSPDGIIGVRTGFTEVDKLTLGLQRGDLIVLAARPSMGKTTLAQNIADHVAIVEKLPVAIFSLEMSGEALAMRMLSSNSGIDNRRLRTGQLLDHEWGNLVNAVEMTKTYDMWIDTAQATTSHMKRRCREIETKTKKKLGLVVIDYLQLMEASGGGKDGRAQQVASISRSLKAMAKELDAPVVALSQLNRGLELRPDKRPIMADLRESGAIEQDADLIMFLYRDEVYDPNTPTPGVTEVIIGKQRNGPIGVVNLRFDRDTSRFSNIL